MPEGLTKCKACGTEIAKSAKTCPKCGAKVKRPGCLLWVLGIVALLWVIGIVGTVFQDSAKQDQLKHDLDSLRAEAKRVASLPPEERAAYERQSEERRQEAELTRRREQGLAWTMSTDYDQMTGKPIQWATVNSTNMVEFGFPYQGAQRAILRLRAHPRYGRDVLLSVDRGQFLTGIDGCNVGVRFDEGRHRTFSAAEPGDHSTTTLFITDYQTFVAGLRRAKVVYIEAPFYQEGNRVFRFEVDHLDWK